MYYKIWRAALPGMVWTLVLFSTGILSNGWAQQQRGRVAQADTVAVRAGSRVWIGDSSFVVRHDTVLIRTASVRLRIEPGPPSISDSFYQSIRAQTNRNILTRTLGNFVRGPGQRNNPDIDTLDFRASVESFTPFAGKNIMRIEFQKVDVLAGSVRDTTLKSSSFISNTLNAVHVKTKDQIIADNLLFGEGDQLQPLDLADTERILRTLPSIEDAKIYVIPDLGDTNNVTIRVVTKDVFSWGLGVTLIAADKYRVRLINRNVLGWGAEVNYALLYDKLSTPPLAHDFQYYIYNMGGSFIAGTFHYIYSHDRQVVDLSFNRPFVSPQIKYIGSLNLRRNRTLIDLNSDSLATGAYITSLDQDLWLGRVWSLGKWKERNNLVLSGRAERIQYSERPGVEDFSPYWYNRTLLLGRISYAHINYLKSRMIYSFARTEDVPYGLLWQWTGGYEIGETANRTYLGSDLSWANSFEDLGYLGFSAEFGIFKHGNTFEQGALNLRLLYFSPLLDFDHFHLRQIIKVIFTNGINRFAAESLDLKAKLTGFSSAEPAGKSNLILNLETEFFSPWYLYGFRFAFFAYGDFAWLASRAFISSPTDLYSVAGLGCRVKNESLVFNTLNFRFGYFIRPPQGIDLWNFEIVADHSEISQGLLGLKPETAQYK